MKYFVLSVVCLISVVQGGLLTDEQKQKIMQIHAECLKETGVDEAITLQAQKGEYVDDPKLKKQIFCFNKKAGFQNEAGELQIDKIKANLMEMIKDSEKADELIKQCNIKKENGEETAFAVTKCFHNLAPNKDFLA
ncbi:B1 protein-like [Anoplophora glabripennis]|uniref:B1 protein-like n=1 Tax=Anoplophora glabripennis TaxID=217634 RepID=UPI0008751599|nr:B1 protein-like [Anoplophora glabripennis]